LQSVGKQQRLKAAAGQLTAAKGKYEGAQAQLAYTEIRSPIAGVVADRPLYPGETATAGTPIITVVNTSEVIARAHIPQDQAALLKVGAPATVSAPGLNSPVPGTVTVVSPAADPNSTTIEVWVKVKNPNEQLRPGTTAQLSMVARRVADATVIPAAALLKSENGRESVMTVGPDRKAHLQAVQAGIQKGNEIQILSGLKPGERVITKGAYGLPNGTQVEWNTASAPVEPNDGAHP
jgi:RND family efflux transporter MFP subunit